MRDARFTLSLSALVGLGLVACSGGEGSGSASGAGSGASGSTSAELGAAGGQLESSAGRLEVPAGALDAQAGTVRFRLSSSAAAVAGGATRAAGPAARAEPAGQTFRRPLTLTIPYDPARLARAGLSPSDLIVLQRDDATGRIEALTPTRVDPGAATVSVQVSSFSTFQPALHASELVDLAASVLQVSHRAAVADGSQRVTLRVSLVDRLDRLPIADAPLDLSSDRAGTFASPPSASDRYGIAQSDFSTTTPGRHTFTLRVGGQALGDQPAVDFAPPNGPPVAVADSFAGLADALWTQAAPGVLANDTDPDGDPRRVSAADSTSALGVSLSVDADGAFRYDPRALPAAVALPAGATLTDTFSYTASAQGGSSRATVTLTLTGVNDAPRALDDAGASTDEDSVLTVSAAAGLLANDSDPDAGATLQVSAVNGAAGSVGAPLTLASGAILTVAADGSYTFDPRPGYGGLAAGASANETFSYTLSDGVGGSDTAAVSVAVTGVNDPPVGSADSYTQAVGNTRLQVHNSPSLPARVVGDVLDNDSDPEGQALSVVAATQATAQGGSVTIDAAGQFTYTPRVGFTGSDSFSYTLRDPQGASASASVTLQVQSLVWYVDAGAPAGGDGRDATPFNTLGAADAATPAANTHVRVSGAASGDLTLASGQRLSGQGVALSLNGFTLQPAGARNTLDCTLTLGSDNVLEGFEIERTASGAKGLVGSNFGTLEAPGLRIRCADGPPLELSEGALHANTSFPLLRCTTSSSGGVLLERVTGTFSATSLELTTTGGPGLRATEVGALDVAGGAIDATGGRALHLDTTTGSLTLSSLSATDSDAEGVLVDALTGSGSFSIGQTSVTDSRTHGVCVRDVGARTLSFGALRVSGAGVSPSSVGVGLELATGNAGATFRFTSAEVSTDHGTGISAGACQLQVSGSAGPTVLATGGPALSLQGTSGRLGAQDELSWTRLASSGSVGVGLSLRSLASDLEVTGTTTISSAGGTGVEVTGTPAGLTLDLGACTVTGGSVGVTVGSSSTVNHGAVHFESLSTSGTGSSGLILRDTKSFSVRGTLSVTTPGAAALVFGANTANGGGVATIGDLSLSAGAQDGLTCTPDAGRIVISAGEITVASGGRGVLMTGPVELDVTLTRFSGSTTSVALQLTDTSGSFTVTGDGGAALGGNGSGGTLTLGSGVLSAIDLTRAGPLTLRNMSFQDGRYPIFRTRDLSGTSALEYCSISGQQGPFSIFYCEQAAGTGGLTLRGVRVSDESLDSGALGTLYSNVSGSAAFELDVKGSEFLRTKRRLFFCDSEESATSTTTIGGAGSGEGNLFADAATSRMIYLREQGSSRHEATLEGNTYRDALKSGGELAIGVGLTTFTVRSNLIEGMAASSGTFPRFEAQGVETWVVDANDFKGPFTGYTGLSAGAITGTCRYGTITNNRGGQSAPLPSLALRLRATSGTSTVLCQDNDMVVTPPAGVSAFIARASGSARLNMSMLDNTLAQVPGAGILIETDDPGASICTNLSGNNVPVLTLRAQGGIEVEGPTTGSVQPPALLVANPGTPQAFVSGSVVYSDGAACPTPP